MRSKFREAFYLGVITGMAASNTYVWKTILPYSDLMPLVWGGIAIGAAVLLLLTLALPRKDDPT